MLLITVFFFGHLNAVDIKVKSSVAVSCHGAQDGSVVLQGLSGQSPYTYKINNQSTFSNSDTFSGLASGNYWGFVKDSNGDIDSVQFFLAQPSALSITNSVTIPNCPNNSTGQININVSGGSGGYSYSWTKNGQIISNTRNIANLKSGTYILEVTDVNLCQVKDTIVVGSTNPISHSAIISDISCYNVNDGSIKITISGTSNTYSINWTGPGSYTSSLSEISNLKSGNYNLTIIDDTTLCEINKTYFIKNPAELIVSIKNKRNVSCYGDSNGLIQPLVIGGSQPYFYEWTSTNGQQSYSSRIIDARMGNYNLVVTDNRNCTDTLNTTITEPLSLLLSSNIKDVTCYSSQDGSIELTVGRGLPPYIYKWSTGDTSKNLASLYAGDYNIIVTDSNGCNIKRKLTVGTPAPLAINYSTKDVKCFGDSTGSFTFYISGGIFPWKYFSVFPNGDTSLVAVNKNLFSGNYKVFVEDNNLCNDSAIIYVSQPDSINLDLVVINPACNGGTGSISAKVLGGVKPYSFDWIDSSGSLFSGTQNVLGLNKGRYYLQFSDANQCSIYDSLIVEEPPKLELSNDSVAFPYCLTDTSGYISFITVGGTKPYELYLNNNLNNGSGLYSGLATGKYIGVVIDSNFCSDTIQIDLKYLDTIKPQIIINSPTIYLDNLGKSNLTSQLVDNGTSDNCGISKFELQKTQFNCNDLGLVTTQLTVSDFSNNTITQTVSLTVKDTIPPNIKVKPVATYLNSQGLATVNPNSVNNGTFDNCSIDSFILIQSQFTCKDLGINSIPVRVVDVSGNVSLSNVSISVLDTTKPVLKYQTVNCYLSSSGLGIIDSSDIDAGSFDNCSITRRTIDKRIFSCADLGNNFVRYTIYDKSGNFSSALVKVVVIDTVSPEIRTKSKTLYLNQYGYTVLSPNDIDDNSTDNCAIASKVINQSVFSCNDVGNRIVTLSVFDPSGNVSSSNIQVTIKDTTNPINKTRNPTIYLDQNGVARLSVYDVDNGTKDNCGISVSSISEDKFFCFERGTKTLKFKSVDNIGNESISTFEVKIRDTIRPVIKAIPKDIYLNQYGSATISPEYFDNGSFDNCGIKNKILSKSSFNCSDIGNANIVYEIIDSSGNNQLEVLSFRVYDTISPIIKIPNYIRFLDSTGVASISFTDVVPFIRDNCEILSIELSDTTFLCDKIGLNQVFCTVIDKSLNKSRIPFFVEVFDTIRPVLKLKNIDVLIDTSGYVDITPYSLVDSIKENCGIKDIYISNKRFFTYNEGLNFVYISVVDNSNNSSGDIIGQINVILGDLDQDSIPDYIEGPYDFDGDLVPNYLDKDSDNDGILDVDENGGFKELLDQDEDGYFNIFDIDTDGDGIMDLFETNGFDVEPYDGRIGIGKVNVDIITGIPILSNNAAGASLIDTDSDGINDFKDVDSDNDGIDDSIEKGKILLPVDTDGDGIFDFRDTDSDNDGIDDIVEGITDTDGDLLKNYVDLDSDNDLISDSIEGVNDLDLDGLGNWIDTDSDGDGIKDKKETQFDSDKDGLGNWLDIDADNDGISDIIETENDFDSDGYPNFLDIDSDNDFIKDSIEAIPLVGNIPFDNDNDGVPDYLDYDSDNDIIDDYIEGTADADNDGIMNYRDFDSDNDGVDDLIEGNGDTDSDGIPDVIDEDSDNDGIPDIIEGNDDVDADLVPNYKDLDSDNDGINDIRECGYSDSLGTGMIKVGDTLAMAQITKDIDGDGLYNFVDNDSDGDGISDLFESGFGYYDLDYNGMVDGSDADGDGIFDYADGLEGQFGDRYDLEVLDSDADTIRDFEDIDSDNDRIPDVVETWIDHDFDGISSYLDYDSDNDKIFDVIETADDFDNDGLGNFIDLDSDGDNIIDEIEGTKDYDRDGSPNYLDFDSDNDGKSDLVEGLSDKDRNNRPDYIDPKIFVPEIFTPNKDGINELLILTGLNNYPNSTLSIYNQWGQLVYQSNGLYNNDWDGTYLNSGKVLSEGIYFYILQYKRDDDEFYKRSPEKGNIYIKP